MRFRFRSPWSILLIHQNFTNWDRVSALVIALISLAYLEEDGLLLSIALLASVIVLAVEFATVWETIRGAKWIFGRW